MHIYVDSSEEEIKSAQLSSIKPHKPLLTTHSKKESSKEAVNSLIIRKQFLIAKSVWVSVGGKADGDRSNSDCQILEKSIENIIDVWVLGQRYLEKSPL